MQNFWNKEPALIIGFVQSAVILAVSFGLNLTTEQQGAILAVTSTLLALLTRSKVTPAP